MEEEKRLNNVQMHGIEEEKKKEKNKGTEAAGKIEKAAPIPNNQYCSGQVRLEQLVRGG